MKVETMAIEKPVSSTAQQRLLEVAILEFGLRGRDGASTRTIAKAAHTAMSSITYHYGGKNGLYLAAADHIAQQLGAYMSTAIGNSDTVETPSEARIALQEILAAFAQRMLQNTDNDWSLFIVREQINPTEAFERIYSGLMGQMMERLATLIRLATGCRDQLTAQIATITLVGQAIVIRASRASCLRLLRRDAIDAATAMAFQGRIAANLNTMLDFMISETKLSPL